jgi:hypothetical protein
MAQVNVSMSFDGKGFTNRTISAFVAQLADDVEREIKKNTPIKTGNARRNWQKTVSSKTFDVTNKVPYIERLEAGASRQAPRGMIGPTLTTIKGKYK